MIYDRDKQVLAATFTSTSLLDDISELGGARDKVESLSVVDNEKIAIKIPTCSNTIILRGSTGHRKFILLLSGREFYSF